MRWSGLFSIVFAACALIPTVAFAEDAPYAVQPDPSALPPLPAPVAIVEVRPVTIPAAPEDTVYLRGGGMIRGTIEELLPGRHVTIAISTGEVRKVPWVEVARVVVANAPGAPGLTASGPQIHIDRPETVAEPMTGPLVKIHISSTKHVQLYRRSPGTQGWTHACHSPCDLDLPLGDDYRISGSSMSTSHEFRLAGAAGDRITLRVNPTSTGGMVIGGVVAGVGAMSMYFGVLANAGSSYRSDKDQGYTAIGVGVAAVAVGTVILLASVGTGVSQTEASKRKDGYVREPSWLTPRMAMKRPPTLQILSRQF